MKGGVAVLSLLFFVFVRLDDCDGLLQCKHGDSKRFSFGGGFYDNSVFFNKTCREELNPTVCVAVICTKPAGFSEIHWGCLPDQRGDIYAEQAKKDWFKNETELASIECRIVFGEEGKNLSNVNITLPAVPKGLLCLYGERDEDGIGEVKEKECPEDSHYCFKANCAEGDGNVVHSEWGCSADTNSTALSAKVGKPFNSTVNCECLYGKKDTDCSNSNLIKTTTTTTEKTSATTTPDTNVDFGEGRKTGLLCVLDKICTDFVAKEKNGTAKLSRRFAPHLVKESGKCKKLGDEVKAGKDQVENLGNELSESIQKVGLVFVDDYILVIE